MNEFSFACVRKKSELRPSHVSTRTGRRYRAEIVTRCGDNFSKNATFAAFSGDDTVGKVAYYTSSVDNDKKLLNFFYLMNHRRRLVWLFRMSYRKHSRIQAFSEKKQIDEKVCQTSSVTMCFWNRKDCVFLDQ